MLESNFVRQLIQGLLPSLPIKQNLILQSLDKNCPSLQSVIETLESFHHSVYSDKDNIKGQHSLTTYVRKNENVQRLKCGTCNLMRNSDHKCSQCYSCNYWGHLARYCNEKNVEFCRRAQGPVPPPRGQKPGVAGVAHNHPIMQSSQSTPEMNPNQTVLLMQGLTKMNELLLKLGADLNKDSNVSNYVLSEQSSLLNFSLTSPISSEANDISDSNVWIVDSGCTKSISKIPLDKEQKTLYTDVYQNANGSIMKASGITGDIHLKLNATDGTCQFTLSDTSYVPDSAYNLLSIPSLCKKGFKILFDGNFCHFFNKSLQYIMKAQRMNDLYCLVDYSRQKKQIQQHAHLTKGTTKITPQLLHERFAHLSMDSIKRILENNAASGLPNLPVTRAFDEFKCDSCLKGKAHAQPFPTSKTDYLPLECIHVDIHFPGEESIAGHKACVTLVDRFSSYTTSVPIKKKSELRDILMNWVNWAETQANKGDTMTSYRIKIINLDGAREGLTNIFKDFCKDRGIELRVSLPHTSEQNGPVERKHYTVMNLTRTLLLRAKAPLALWHETIMAATCAQNFSIKKGMTKTAYELFFNRKPNFLPLRVWGCRAYVLIEPHHRDSKLSPRAQVGRFVGYSQTHKGYRILLDDKNCDSVVESRNVVLFEDNFDVSEDLDLNAALPSVPDISLDLNSLPIVFPLADFQTLNLNVDEDDDDLILTDDTTDVVPPSNPPNSPPTDTPVETFSDECVTDLDTSISLDSVSSLTSSDSLLSSLHVEPASPLSATSAEGFMAFDDTVPSLTLDTPTGGLTVQPAELLPPTDEDGFLALFSQQVVNPKELRGSEIFVENPNIAIFVIDEPTLQRAFATVNVPKNVYDALNGPDKDLWREALEKELNSLTTNNTWTLTQLPPGRKAIPCRWVLTIKYNDKGEIDRYKARLVLQGFRQVYGVDYNETFAPTGKLTTLRILLALAAENGWYDASFDVDTAFLHADLKEEIYMKQPPGFEEKDPILRDHVCKLFKSIYGLKQAPREFYLLIKEVLTTNGFEVSPHDPCLFTKTSIAGIVYAHVTVDDVKVFSDKKTLIADFESMLSQKFKIKKPNSEFHLGIHIHRKGLHEIHINQEQYVKDVLQQYNMTECRPVATPMEPGLELSTNDCPKTEEDKLKMKDKNYRALIGSLQYLSVATRPDITQAVSKLSRYLQNPGIKMWKAGLRVLQYLKGTANVGITYRRKGSNTIEPYVDNGVPDIQPFCDADLAGDLDTRRSTTGYVIIISGGAVSWGSKLQSVVAHSTTEAEYLAVDYLTREVIWMKRLLGSLRYNIGVPILLSDNNGCIAISKNPSHHTRTKHIDIRYNYIRDQLLLNEVGLKYVSTNEMAADIFTKPLPSIKFQTHREKIGMVPWTST
jgi:hypothetical protein